MPINFRPSGAQLPLSAHACILFALFCMSLEAADSSCYDTQTNTSTFCKECESCEQGICTLKSNYCKINDHCYGAGDLFLNGHPPSSSFPQRPFGFNLCDRMCDPSRDPSAWSPAPYGHPCTDGLFCTGSENFCVNPDEVDKMDPTHGCTGNIKDPCSDQPFCGNICQENSQSLFPWRKTPGKCESRPYGTNCTSGDTSPIPECRFQRGCVQGTCGFIVDDSVSCLDCPCAKKNQMCNISSGACTWFNGTKHNFLKSTSRTDADPESRIHSILWGATGGGVAAVLIALVVLVVLVVARRRRVQEFQHRTVYHRVDEEDPIRIINKGL